MRRAWMAVPLGLAVVRVIWGCSGQPFGSATSSDGGGVEGGSGVEGGGDAPPTGYCASHTNSLFCSDWDESQQTDPGWSAVSTFDGGALVVDPGTSASPPNSLKAMMPGFPSSGDFGRAAVRADVVLTQPSVNLHFAFRVDTTTPGIVEVAALNTFLGGTTYSLFVHVDTGPNDVVLSFGELSDGGPLLTKVCSAGTITFGTWHSFDLTLGSQPSLSVSASLDGMTPCAPMTTLNLPPLPMNLTITVWAGDYYENGPSRDTTVHIDNVLVTSK